jgi:hypothetical protein
MACPTHTKRTSSGHILCIRCYEKRRARKEQQRQAAAAGGGGGGTGFQDLESGGRPTPREQEYDEHAALTASARATTPPWKLSLYAAIAATVFVLIILIIPGFRRIPMGASYFPTSLCVLFIATLSAFWAAIGLMSKDPEQEENRGRCLSAIGLAVVSAILAFIAIITDPAKAIDQENERVQMEQINLTPEERQEQTRRMLEEFR